MAAVVAIAAETFELTPWLSRLDSTALLDWPLDFARRARWGTCDLFAIANGAGPRMARKAIEAAAERTGKIDRVLSVGLCGGLEVGLAHGAIYTASSVGDGQQQWAVEPVTGAASKELLSIDRFLRNTEEKANWASKGFEMVEMEAAGIAAWAQDHRIPFHAVKAVSDIAGESFAIDFNAYRDGEGRFIRGQIARAALRHPVRYVPELIRMAFRGKAACQKLGEFLAQHPF